MENISRPSSSQRSYFSPGSTDRGSTSVGGGLSRQDRRRICSSAILGRSYLRGQRFYLDPGDPPAGYKCETLRPTGQSCGVGERAGVKGVRAIRCPHLCCQLMPGHCEGSLVSVPNLLGRCCLGSVLREKGAEQKGRAACKKQGRQKKPAARGYWRACPRRDPGITPSPVRPSLAIG